MQMNMDLLFAGISRRPGRLIRGTDERKGFDLTYSIRHKIH